VLRKKIKTARDVINSLDVVRKQKVSSMTEILEENLKAELEESIGPILSEEELTEIITKEQERRDKQDTALKKSRIKIMKLKERAKLVQKLRQNLGKYCKTKDEPAKSKESKCSPQAEEPKEFFEPPTDAVSFKTMKITY
jgi:hypothetical protein